MLFVCAECPKKLIANEVMNGCTIFPIDRQKQPFNHSLANTLGDDACVVHVEPSKFKVLCAAADFTRGFLGLFLVRRFAPSAAKIHVIGFNKKLTHHRNKAILYHQIQAEHQTLSKITAEFPSKFVLLDPSALRSVAAYDEPINFPCPHCGKKSVVKKVGHKRVLCQCGSTYDPSKVPKRTLSCLHDRGRVRKTHEVVFNGFDKYGCSRFYCYTCEKTYGASGPTVSRPTRKRKRVSQ